MLGGTMQKKKIMMIGIIVLLILLIGVIGINVIKPKEEPPKKEIEQTPEKVDYNDGIDNKADFELYLEENFHKDGYEFQFVSEKDKVVTYKQVNKKTKDEITFQYDLKKEKMIREEQEQLSSGK